MMGKIKYWIKHNDIQAFGLALATITLCLVLTISNIAITAAGQDRDYLNGNAMYVSEFVTSLSGIAGNIVEVYTNDSNTKCGIVIQLDKDQISNISTDANDYQMYVKGYNISKGTYAARTLSNPTGGYYVFGETGYAMIYLVDSAGFQNQALEIVVRCNEYYSSTGDSDEELKEKDASYANHDQFRIIINPHGESAVKASFLDDLDVVKLYQNTVAYAEEDKIREKLTADVKQLNEYISKINSYAERLDTLGVSVQGVPNCVMEDADSFATEKITAEDGTEAELLVYHPGYVFPGGVDFDWFKYKLIDGNRFLPDLIGVKSAQQYLLDLTENKDMTSYTMGADAWYMKDGTKINLNSNTESTLVDVNAIRTDIQIYTQTVNEYIRLKQQYQTVDMVSYLSLEYNIETTGETFTSNYSEDTVIVW